MDDTKIDTPTNDQSASAEHEIKGGINGASLSEDDLVNYFSERSADIPKSFDGRHADGKDNSVPFPFESTDSDESNVNAESDDEVSEADLALLDDDSDNTDTKVESKDEAESDPVFEIQVDGKKIEVKQSELIADAQKWRAATTKFDEASKMRKEADEIKGAYVQERETLRGLINHYQNFIEGHYKSLEPDWETLYTENPLEYFKQKEIFEGRMAQAQQAKALQDQIRKQEQAELQEKQHKFVEEQRAKLHEKFPAWKNESVALKAANDITAYLEREGFSTQELAGLDARALTVSYKAHLYDKLVNAKDAKKAKQQPSRQTLKAGATPQNGPGFAQRQEQTRAAREAKAVNDTLRNDPSDKNLEAYFASQWSRKK